MNSKFRVYNADGQQIGTYFAKDEKHAVRQARDDQTVTGATFRKSQPGVDLGNLTAKKIEIGDEWDWKPRAGS